MKEAKSAKKTKIDNTDETIQAEAENPEVSLFGYQGLLSLFAVCESAPSKLKSHVDDLLVKKPDDKDSTLKVIFLYFFQMSGVNKSDEKTLGTMFDFLLRKNPSGGKAKEMTKEHQDSLKFDVNQAMVFGSGKEAQVHLRQLKKFCKLLVTNLVDLFPARKELLIDVAREICNFSRLRIRLVRYSFTFIGMLVLKNLFA